MTDIITIDGPTSSGKNSVGFYLAKKLGYQYIDTGMIYRVGTYLVLKNKISLHNEEEIAGVFKRLKIEIKTDENGLRICNEGEDLTDILHTTQITENVSIIAAIKDVRGATKIIQRKLGEAENTVMTGRDIGSEIFPNARCKFYLTANARIRAKRRYEQLRKEDPNISFEDVYQSMIDRDRKDTTRDVSPLRIPEGAVVIDNSDLTVEQTVEKMLNYCKPLASF